MSGGIYIVTLNNDELISTQAHDRRFDNKPVLKVNKENIKFGQAVDFEGRKEYGYFKTFGKNNVNYIPVVAVKSDDLKAIEDAVKEKLIEWRLRSPANRITEWTVGISKEQIIDEILSATVQLKIDHKVLWP